MYGQAFMPDEGVVIGRLDEDGNLVLAADLATTQPDVFRMLSQSGILDKPPRTVAASTQLEQSPRG